MNFWKSLLSSCLGTILGLGSLALVVAVSIRACSSGGPDVKPNSVLTLSFKSGLPELTNNAEGGGFGAAGDFSSLFQEKIGLNDFQKLISLAAEDDDIKGIFLNLEAESTGEIGQATLSKVRQSLQEFKAKGKFILAYSNGYTQKSYYLASVADKIYLNPQGGFDFRGFGAQLMFFKGMFDKLGLKAQVFYAGKFKSATEPFRLTQMSDENRLQVRQYLEGMYGIYLQHLSESRSIPAAQLRQMADSLAIRKPQHALDLKLVDGLKYRDEVLDEIKERLGIEKTKTIEGISLDKYLEAKKAKLAPKAKSNVVAVIVAQGDIVDGEGETGQIGGERYARLIRKLRQDKAVKAIVLRINSGGGSALASDIIWRELEQAKAQGIKVVSSMGDVAASGGYYIACGTERIFAEPNTITGSIGVFGLIPNWRELLEQKMGITMDTVKTGRYSTMDGMFYGFEGKEAEFIQESVDEVYTTFKQRVSKARKKSMEAVDEIAQGRVWTGLAAKENGLVDELGGTQEAIKAVAELANLSDYAVMWYPEIKSPWESLFDQDNQEKKALFRQVEQSLQSQQLGEFYPFLQQLHRLRQMQGVQARMPFELKIQ